MKNTKMIQTKKESNNTKTAYIKLIEMAIKNNSDVSLLSKVKDLHDEQKDYSAKQDFYSALSEFQGIVATAHKSASASFITKSGGQMCYTFASLDDVIKATKASLKATQLSFYFKIKQEPNLVTVSCTISHPSGHSESCQLSSPLDASGQKNILQQIGSTVSYLKRYTLCAALGVATSDDRDDGHFYSTYDAVDPESVRINYHDEIEKILDKNTQGNTRGKALTFLSQKLERKVSSIADLDNDEARKYYLLLSKV